MRKFLFLNDFMKLILLLTAAVLFFGHGSFESASAAPQAAPAQFNLSQTAAQWPSGEKITVGDVHKIWISIASARKDEFPKDFFRLLLLMIDQKNIQHKSKEMGLDQDPAFLKKKEDMTSLFLQKTYMDEESRKIALVDPEFPKKEKETFDEKLKTHPDFGDESFEVRHILLEDEAAAFELYKKISSGGMKEFEASLPLSLDKKSIGGSLGKIRKKQLPAAVVKAIGPQKNGLAGGRPLQLIPGGYSIVWIMNRETVSVPTLDSKEGKEIAWDELRSEYILKALETKRREAQIKLMGPNGQVLTDPSKPDGAWSSVDFSKIDDALTVAQFTKDASVQTVSFKRMKEMSMDLLKGEALSVENYIPILQYVIDRILIQAFATESQISKTQETKEGLETMVRGLLQSMYFDKLVEQIKPSLTQGQIQAGYEKFLKLLGDTTKVRIRHILVDNKETSDKILEELKKNNTGEVFKKLVKSYSKDKDTKDKEGDLGELPLRMFPENIAAKIKSVASGTTVLEAFEIPGAGYLILRVEDKKVPAAPDLKNVSDRIQDSLAKQQVHGKVLELRHKDIKIFDLQGKEMKIEDIAKNNQGASA